jgi:hypothetical protein
VVKLGFIVEGDSEKIILESEAFIKLLQEFKIDFIPEIVNASGGGNLLPRNREDYVQILKDKGATKIIILVDQEDASCITSVKELIEPNEEQKVIVSVKTLEAWFLADSISLAKFLKVNSIVYEHPETFLPALDEIIRVNTLHNNRGVSDKKLLAKRMLLSGFSIQNAAAHKNCPSAKYFLQKIKDLSQN